MPNKYFQLFTVYILITFCVADFLVILVFTTCAWYSCRVHVRRSSTEPCINWWRLSREAEERFTNFTCPTATRMDFTTANRCVPFSPSLLPAVLQLAWYSQPFHSPLLPNSQVCEQVVKTGILSSESRWFVLLFKVSRMLGAVSNRGRSLFPLQNRHTQSLFQNILTLSAFMYLIC